MSEPVIVKERRGGKYTQDVMTSRHHYYADEPESYGSADLGPTPYELLCASLGACTSITLRMYIERKKWDVTHIGVEVSHKKVSQVKSSQAKSSQEKTSQGNTSLRDVFTRKITIEGDVDDTQRARLIEIAGKCPVHKTLETSSNVVTLAI